MAQAPADSPALELRDMTAQDLVEVCAIERESFPAPWSSTYFRQCILSGYDCWVFEQEGRIEAYAILSVSGATGHLLNLCVRKDSRGQGLGRRMLRSVLEYCEERVGFLLLEVRPSNVVAINLYKSVGLREFGVRPGYYRDHHGREDAVVMIKRFCE